MLAEKVVLADEKKGLSQVLERSQQLQDQLNAQIEAMSNQVGVPRSEVDKLKALLSQRETEITTLSAEN